MHENDNIVMIFKVVGNFKVVIYDICSGLLGCISKNEKNRCSRCCCYSVPPPRIGHISRSYFLKHNLDISLALLIPQVCCF